ncbi:hypothetical protein JCM6882_004595 [Rhodosporidiobolus microsporus]
MSSSSAPAAPLPQPTFSFIHVLQLVQPVSPSSPYRLPAAGLGPGQILPSRLAKTAAPFAVAKPTDLNALYRLANQGRDPEDLRRERNRKKKERKMRNKEQREAAGEGGEGEKAEGEDADADAPAPTEGAVTPAAAAAAAPPSRLAYGLPSDIPSDFFLLFETHYHRHHHAASQQREQAWKLVHGEDAPAAEWGDIVLHDAVSRAGKRDTGKGGFSLNEKTGKTDFHWVV